MKKSFSKLLSKVIAVCMCLVLSFGIVACKDNSSSGGGPKNNNIEVWTAYSSEKILQDFDYSHRYASKTLTIGAFRNEWEGAQIMFTPEKAVDSYTLTINDLKKADGTVLSKDAFEAYVQMYMEVTAVKDQQSLTGGGVYPEALLPYENAVMHGKNTGVAGGNNGIWVEVKPSETQAAGLYTGSWTLTCDGVAYNIPVQVTVYDFYLDDAKQSKSVFFTQWREVGHMEQNTSLKVQNSYANFLLEHRVECCFLPGNDVTIYNTTIAVDRFIEEAKMYANDERVTRYNFPYSHTEIKAVKLSDNKSELLADSVTCAEKYYAKTILEKVAEASLDTVDDAEQFNLMAKMQTYYVYFDEYTQSDKLGEAQYTNIITPIWYQEIAHELLYEMAEDRGLFDRLTSDEKELLDDYYARITGDRRPSGQQVYTWESYAYGEFLLSLNFLSTDVVTDAINDLENVGSTAVAGNREFLDGQTGREYRKQLYKTLGYSRDLKDGSGNYITMSLADAAVLDSAINKLLDAVDPFEKAVIIDTANMKNLTVGEWTENMDFKTIFVPLLPDYDTSAQQDFYKNLTSFWWDDVTYGEVWAYTAINPRDPYPTYHIEGALLTSRLFGWMQYEYNIVGNLYWDTVVDRNYQNGEQIQDFYTNPIRYGGGNGANGEGFLLFPGKVYDVTWNGVDGEGDDVWSPVASIRLKSIRDGYEEYDLLYALEQFSINRATAMGQTYNEAMFDNLMAYLSKDAYFGASCLLGDDYTDIAYLENFANMRLAVAQLLELANAEEVTLDWFQAATDRVEIKVSAPAGKQVKLNGEVLTNGVTVGGYTQYSETIMLNKAANYLNLEAGDKAANIYLGGSVAIFNAGADTNGFTSANFDTNQTGGADEATFADTEEGVQITFTPQATSRDPRANLNVTSFNVGADATKISIKLRVDQFNGTGDFKIKASARTVGGSVYQEIIPNTVVAVGDWVVLEARLPGAINSVRFTADTQAGATITVSQIVIMR